MEITTKELLKNIQLIRKSKGLSQEEMAENPNCSIRKFWYDEIVGYCYETIYKVITDYERTIKQHNKN
ncbi:hypothetical protein FACS1894153_4320 [Bacteroidia bacterium]|nr:hypothetical protein FACS1894153_4320 [Bacteroidia bacterium]